MFGLRRKQEQMNDLSKRLEKLAENTARHQEEANTSMRQGVPKSGTVKQHPQTAAEIREIEDLNELLKQYRFAKKQLKNDRFQKEQLLKCLAFEAELAQILQKLANGNKTSDTLRCRYTAFCAQLVHNRLQQNRKRLRETDAAIAKLKATRDWVAPPWNNKRAHLRNLLSSSSTFLPWGWEDNLQERIKEIQTHRDLCQRIFALSKQREEHQKKLVIAERYWQEVQTFPGMRNNQLVALTGQDIGERILRTCLPEYRKIFFFTCTAFRTIVNKLKTEKSQREVQTCVIVIDFILKRTPRVMHLQTNTLRHDKMLACTSLLFKHVGKYYFKPKKEDEDEGQDKKQDDETDSLDEEERDILKQKW